MGRSSSSRSKKRSKSSSKGRTKKRSKIRNRRSESKKKLRHYSSDDDDSRSSASSSSYSSSSEDTKHRTRKSHSQVRTKKHVVIKKKKPKRRSYSSESSDEESPIVRKRRGSKRKRNHDSSSKRKSHSKKKRKTVESDSDSYSTDSYFSTSVSRETERSRFRSTSPLCSDHIEDNEYRNEISVNNSRRLKSVIVSLIAEREKEEEEKEKEREKEKEEVICHDDYPSSKSNDSNDSGNKNEENENSNGTGSSGHEIPKNGDLVDPLGDFEENVSTANCKAKTDDLEAVLRQRALENLRNFRRVTSSDQKSEPIKDVAQLPVSTEAQLVKETNILSQVDENTKDMNATALPKKPNISQTPVSSVRRKLVRPIFARQVSETSATVVSHESRDELKRSKSCLDETSSGIFASDEPSLGETVSDKPQKESEDGSDFENKTMSVMRGGEMVQVNYKVYIPKKVPALTRRNLNR